MNKTRWIASIVEILLGIGLVVASIFGSMDSYWTGMGSALATVGFIFLIRQIRYNSSEEYKEEYDIEMNDERNKFIRLKAWSWAGYLFVMLAAVGAIVFKLLGREDLMMFCSTSVCIVSVLYWVSYMVLKNKY